MNDDLASRLVNLQRFANTFPATQSDDQRRIYALIGRWVQRAAETNDPDTSLLYLRVANELREACGG